MSQVKAGSLWLEVERSGNPEAPAILLIQGLGTSLIRWQPLMCEHLVEAGYQVIRFDNRDVGLSSRMDKLGIPDLTRFFKGAKPLSPLYTLVDMAGDAVALLDALGIEKAHIVGASMGGMIAQLIASLHGRRCLSLTSMLSTTGNPALPPPTPEAARAMFSPLPLVRTEESIVEDAMWRQRVVQSPAYPMTDDELRAMCTASYRRGFYPKGVARQLAASLAAGDRRFLLSQVTVPTMVFHGADDPLVPVACGRDTADSIAGAELQVIQGMGHDFPLALAGQFADAILAAARRAD